MKKMFFILSLIFSGNALASAEISIGTLYDYMSGQQSTYLKRIRNQGDVTAFVKVAIHEITYDAAGQPQESAELTEGRRVLIASPSRMIIPANGVQATRLLFMGERDKERYFRVRFIPVLPKQEDGFDLDANSVQKEQQQVSAGVNILTGFGTIIFVMPKESRFDTRIIKTDTMTTVVNKGNATIVLDFFEECDGRKKNCSSPSKIHLLPNMQKQLMKKSDHLYRFELIEGDKSRNMVIGH
jgi:P pilus assembly chaperone PapD